MTYVLMIDNYDSFTYNLVHALHGLAEVEVVRNDQIKLTQVQAKEPDYIILSPGPGRPERKKDFGICGDIIAALRDGILSTPTLGVCLGHQGIASTFGAKIVQGREIMHGKTSDVFHQGTGLFTGLPNPLRVMRYHSLVIEPTSLPECFDVTAHTIDGSLMAIQHKTLPIHGVQFHPESIGTPDGRMLLANFFSVEVRQ